MKRVMAAGAACLAVAAAAQQPAPARQTVQQAFDAAGALDGSGTPAQRLAAWEALEARVANNKRSRAVIRIRKSAALLALDRKDEAVTAARAGLADLSASDATLREDRFMAQLALAQVAEAAVDYATAADEYRKAEAIAATPSEKATVWVRLIRAETYTDANRAAATVARADAALASLKVDRKVSAELRRLNAELLLNRGDFEGARRESAAAVKLLGGLTSQTDLDDVAARSDFAIASLLLGKGEDARRYMAMTGAGRVTDGQFDPGAQMRAPDCGGEAELKPADVAVVEFSVGDDGHVLEARPIYAAGGGAVAQEFARATLDWSWTPEQVKHLPPFFRYRTRVEMRCSTAFTRPSTESYLDERLGAWLADKNVPLPPPPSGADVVALPAERTLVTTTESRAGPQSLALVPILQMIADNAVSTREEANAAAIRALAIADANGAKGLARLAIDVKEWQSRNADGGRGGKFVDLATAALASPSYRDAESQAAIRMLIAAARRDKPTQARAYLAQVGGDAALPASSPLRSAALVQLASIEQASGNIDAARAAFLKSGLTAEQCSIIDAPPRLLHVGGTFPQEAQQWGFEGWTVAQYNINADGRVVDPRPVLAYPPFVFSKAGTATVAGAVYSKTYRPDGGLGCGGSQQRIVFRLPGSHG